MGKSGQVSSSSDNSTKENEEAKDEIVVFLGEYGSYLKMDTCLAYASALKFEAVVDLLLSIAKYDPRHKEVMKQTSKSTAMVFYEPVRLLCYCYRIFTHSGTQKDDAFSCSTVTS